MSEGQGLLNTIFDQLSPVHPDGHKFIAIGAAVTLLFFFLYPPLGWLSAGITAWIIYFFRDPPRVTPLRPGL
ncbi:MAG: phosphatidylserine decarboxylase family protein, partial [Hyphomicrobium sp.]